MRERNINKVKFRQEKSTNGLSELEALERLLEALERQEPDACLQDCKWIDNLGRSIKVK